MSIQGLNDFLYALEHSASLRRDLKNCESDNDLINLAIKNGFPVMEIDLKASEQSERIEQWFNSKAKGIRLYSVICELLRNRSISRSTASKWFEALLQDRDQRMANSKI